MRTLDNRYDHFHDLKLNSFLKERPHYGLSRFEVVGNVFQPCTVHHRGG